MAQGTDVIQGALKLVGLSDQECFKSWEEFVTAIPELFAVEVPNNITNVTLSTAQPTDSERDYLWIKLDGSGSFVGMLIYAQGGWKQIYPIPEPVLEIHHVVGDSRNLPPGFILASADPRVTATQLTKLKTDWLVGGTSPTWYSIFDMTYVGF